MTMKSDLRKSEKRRGKRTPLQNNTPEKDKIRGTVVRLLWRAAAPGLKPLRLPRAQMEVQVHLKNAFPGGIGNRRISFGYNLRFASHTSLRISSLYASTSKVHRPRS